MTRKQRNYKSLLLFGIMSVLMGGNLEASTLFGTKQLTSTQEEMNALAGETEKKLAKAMESKIGEKSSVKKSFFSFSFSKTAEVNPQADLDELAILYQALNYADITAIEYLKRNCNENGGLFVPATDPNLCNSYVPILMKTVEGRIGSVSSQYILSDGILKAPPEWPEHANEILRALEDLKGGGDSGVYGAERSLVKKVKDQMEGRPEEAMGVPTASPIAAIRAPIMPIAPNTGYSNGSNQSYQQPPPPYQQQPPTGYQQVSSNTSYQQPSPPKGNYPNYYFNAPKYQQQQQQQQPGFQNSVLPGYSSYQQSPPPPHQSPPGYPTYSPPPPSYPLPYQTPPFGTSNDYPSHFPVPGSQVMVLVPSNLLPCKDKEKQQGTLTAKSVVPEKKEKEKVEEITPPPPSNESTLIKESTTSTTPIESSSQVQSTSSSSSSDAPELSRENLRWLINHYEKPGNANSGNA